MIERTLNTAPIPTTIATTAKTVSRVPTVRGAEGPFAGTTGALAGAGAGTAGRETAVPGRVAVVGEVAAAAVAGRGICVVGAAGAPGRAPVGAAVAGAATGAAAVVGEAGVAPLGGSDGNLIVGAAVGFGGRAIRTVSFFGWTFAASGGFGGIPPGGGGIGVGSAIKLILARTYGSAKTVSNR